MGKLQEGIMKLEKCSSIFPEQYENAILGESKRKESEIMIMTCYKVALSCAM